VVVPVIFWAVYHYHKDRHLPEPLSHLLLAFGLGAFATVISKLLYMGLEPLGLRYVAGALADTSGLGLLVYAMLAIGPIEELSKLLPFLLVVLRFEEFDEPLDGIICVICTSRRLRNGDDYRGRLIAGSREPLLASIPLTHRVRP
jgi:RsiW-degrading membrane proteinase PrsW (M82 family)